MLLRWRGGPRPDIAISFGCAAISTVGPPDSVTREFGYRPSAVLVALLDLRALCAFRAGVELHRAEACAFEIGANTADEERDHSWPFLFVYLLVGVPSRAWAISVVYCI